MNWPGRVLAVRVAAKCGADVADIVDGIRWVAGLRSVFALGRERQLPGTVERVACANGRG